MDSGRCRPEPNGSLDGARDTFGNTIGSVSDPAYYMAAASLWIGYGVTADGSAVYVGEHQLDTDPTHMYAVLKPKTGKARIVAGGEPARSTPAGCPAGSDQAAGQPGLGGRRRGRRRSPTGTATASGARPSTNALLIPHGADVEVQVERPERTEIVAITPS